MNLNKQQQQNLTKKLNEPHKGEKKIPIDDGLIVDLIGVDKTFINENVEYRVLKSVDLKIKKSEFIVILGPSGSGKTTLMNIISGLERATQGVVNVLGNDLINFDNTELTTFRRENVGYIFQQYGLLPNLTVKDNILLGEYLQRKNNTHFSKIYYKKLNILNKQYKNLFSDFFKREKELKKSYMSFKTIFNKISELNSSEYKQKLDDIMDSFGNNGNSEITSKFQKYREERQILYFNYLRDTNSLSDINNEYFLIDNIMKMLQIDSLAKKYPGQLSGGQQQRVSIARTLIKKPKILFADEPTGAVDTEMSKIIMNSLSQINQMIGTTVVIVTHNPAIAQMADRVIHFFDGTISKIEENKVKKTVDEIN